MQTQETSQWDTTVYAKATSENHAKVMKVLKRKRDNENNEKKKTIFKWPDVCYFKFYFSYVYK